MRVLYKMITTYFTCAWKWIVDRPKHATH